MNEKVFFESGGTKVTNTRFVINNQTYAMSAINSVKVSSIDITQSNTLPGILVIVGAVWMGIALLVSSGFRSYIWPVLIFAAGIIWMRSIKKTIEHTIFLTTSSGEQSVLKSNIAEDILPLEQAIQDAIIYRG